MPQLEQSCLQMPARHLQTLLALLAQHVPQAEVWAYGSRVVGGAHEGSDLDLVLRHAVDPSQDIEGWLDLKEALQESTLPMLVPTNQSNSTTSMPSFLLATVLTPSAVRNFANGQAAYASPHLSPAPPANEC